MRNWHSYQKNSDRPRLTPEEFDRQIREIEAETHRSSIRNLIIGNLQVTGVEPEVRHADIALEFDTDTFFQRAPWTKQLPAFYTNARKWPMEKEPGLFLVGGTGAGKTTFFKTLAIELSKEKPFEDKHVKFVNFGKLCIGVSKDNWSAKSLITSEVVNCRHLFIDDIGTETGFDWEISLLHHVMDSRLHSVDREGNPKKTYLSSNYRIDNLPYHERTIRRIKEAVFEMVIWKPDQKTTRRSNQNPMSMEEAQKGF